MQGGQRDRTSPPEPLAQLSPAPRPRGIYLAARFLYDSDPLTWALLPLIVDFLSALPAKAGGPGCERGSWGCPRAPWGGKKKKNQRGSEAGVFVQVGSARPRAWVFLLTLVGSRAPALRGRDPPGFPAWSGIAARARRWEPQISPRSCGRPVRAFPHRPVRNPRGNDTIFQRN